MIQKSSLHMQNQAFGFIYLNHSLLIYVLTKFMYIEVGLYYILHFEWIKK